MNTNTETRNLNSVFSSIAESHPSKTAFVNASDCSKWSYQILNDRANQIAHFLSRQGVSKGSVVAFELERSAEALCLMLGIIKSGAAYCPIDPDYPEERKMDMCLAAKASLLIGTHNLNKREGDCISLEELLLKSADYSKTSPSVLRYAQSVAYIMFTSGSTGIPKAVQIHDEAIIRLCQQNNPLKILQSDVVLLHSSISFDASTYEFWGTLLSGATLVVAKNEQVSVPFFAQQVSDFDVSVLWLTAPLLPLIVAQDINLVASLRLLVAGGDALQPIAVRQLIQNNPEITIVNGYGPTEATTFSCFFALTVDNVNTSTATSVPIGFALDETDCHVLDENLVEVGDDEFGELYIGGTGVGHGYLNDKRKTALNFVPNPFNTNGGRIYKTGDIVKKDAYGALVFKGRKDHQVKVRGHRIELDEIDSVLNSIDRVKQSASIVVERQDASKNIVSFVVKAESIEIQEVKNKLSEQLPNYMLPTQIIAIDAFPLKSNGKINREKLLDIASGNDAAPEVNTGDTLQNILSELFCDVLSLKTVDPQASFFEMGGDSISAIQLCGLAQENGISISVSDLFEYKSIESLLENLNRKEVSPDNATAEQTLVSIWKEVLQNNKITANSNFFEVGGDSIAAIQAAGMAEQQNLPCSVSDIFEYKNISSIVNSHNKSVSTHAVNAIVSSPLDDVCIDDLPDGVEEIYEASQNQIGMLIQSDKDRQSSSYHDILSHKVRLPFSESHFCLAFSALIDKHEILRTAFDLEAYDQPAQLLHSHSKLNYQIVDLQHLDEGAQRDRFNSVIQEEKESGFDWSKPGLFRIKVLLLQADHFVLTLSFHHAILDGWSSTVLMGDFVDLYTGNVSSQALSGRIIPSYRRFIELERSTIQNQTTREFWQCYLDGCSTTKLPSFLPQEIGFEETRRIQREVDISVKQTEMLKALASDLHVSLKHVLLAVHMRAIALVSGVTDCVSGLVSHGRPETQGAERSLGLFINTLPFRSKIASQNWNDYIEETFNNDMSGFAHRRYPLSNILRDSALVSLFDFAFNFTHFREYDKRQSEHGALVERGAFTSGSVFGAVDFEHSNFGLAVQAGLSADSQQAYLVLDADSKKYSEHLVELLLQAYSVCLEHMLNNPNDKISDIQVEISTSKPSTEAAATPVFFDIMERFTTFVDEIPNNIAVTHLDQTCTYQELDQRSNAIASCLKQQNVQAGNVVAVHAKRSVDTICTLLGIWKIGACYLPVDPAYPESRKSYMLENSACQLVICDTSENELSDMFDSYTLLNIQYALEQGDKEYIACDVFRQKHSPAYLIYTSGSTGRPKGVCVSYSGIANLVSEQASTFKVQQNTNCMQFASLSFDASLFEILMSVVNGGNLHLIDEQLRLDPAALSHYANVNKIEVATLPASVLQTLCDFEWPSQCRMVIAGEAFPVELAKIWSQKAKVVNAYGPTEATIWSTVHACNGEESKTVPIGKPINATEAYVLDDFGNMVPQGVSGELYLGGPAIALGYIHNSRMTSERFVPNPFSLTPGSRLYRTGDRVCMNHEGEIEFLGRIDWQVKLRGYRIELGEIESIIQSLSGVQNAVVVVKKDESTKRQWLACFCQLASNVSAEDIRNEASSQLPSHMLPGDFITLERFPLTVNGKIDREALLNYEEKEDTSPKESEEMTPQEKALISVWKDVFGNESITLDDAFYSLGGDSILSIQLRAMLQKQGFDFELEDLFELQTIRQLAPNLFNVSNEKASDQAAISTFSLISEEIRSQLPSTCEDAYPLSRMQTGMLFHMHYNSDSVRYHDVMYYVLKGNICESAFRKAMDLAIEQHPILRTSFELSKYDQPLQLVYTQADANLAFYDLTALGESEQEAHLKAWEKEELSNPFDIEKPGLLRVFIHQLNPEQYRLTVSCPHAILDGWSAATLISSLLSNYKDIAVGQIPHCESLPLRFADFVKLEQQAIESDEAKSFWESYVADFESCTIPCSSIVNEGETTKRLTFNLTSKMTEIVDALSDRLQVSTKSVFLSLHLRALSLLSGQSKVSTGLITHGRPEAEGSDKILGVFLNNLPFKYDLSNQSRWESFIKDVDQLNRSQSAHRRFPLSEIKALADGQSLFEVAFNYTAFRPYESMSQDWLDSGGHDYSNYLFVLQAGLSPVSNEYYLFLDVDCSRVDDFYENIYRQVYEHVLDEFSHNCFDKLVCHGLPDSHLLKLEDWQGEASHESGDVWQAFEAVVKSQPDGIAVREGERQVSYQALAERVAQWSSVLQAEGVSSGEAVGVLLERGVDAITAILAIVRCGARYVPLDKGYPDTRIASMLSTAGVSVVLTDGSEHEGMKGARSLALQDIDKRRCAPCEAVSRSGVSGLYVMYTSGSTGTPKGVQVPDGAVLRLCRQPTLSLSAQDTLLLQAPLVFDASTLELWGALLNGATVAIGQGGAMSVPRLAQDIEQYGVSVLWLTASLFHVVMDEQPDALSGLRCLIAGGDTLSGRHVSEYLGADASRKLVNGYGPTEATTFSCLYAMNTHDAHQDVPIGYPLAQSSCYVLNDAAQRVPLGVPGELYVGGAGLADGYLGESVKTALAFVPNPYGPAGSRMYRTGDRVRYNAAGALEFLGRQDAQVKIRGYRIELGEISHALDSYEGLVHALVWVDEEGGHKRLMAAVSGEVDAVEVQGYLRDSLPDYMQPHRVHVLSQMPLTINGKIDKAQVMRMLAAQDKESQGESAAQPASELEARLIAIWEDVLQVDSVSRHDSFFELGGDSILSIQLAARAAADDIHFSLEDLFEHDTVAALAKAIGQEQTTDTHHQQTQAFELIDKDLAAQLPNEIEDAYPLSQTQLGMLYHSERGRAYSAYHDILTHTVQLPFVEQTWRQAWQHIIARHAILRTAFDMASYHEALQLVYSHAELPLTVEEQQALSTAERQARLAQWTAEEKALGFDWQQPGLLRGHVFVHKDNAFVLGLSFHHAIMDGWSTSILMRDLTDVYQALLSGDNASLPEMHAGYCDYIAQEQQALADEQTQAYWQDMVAQQQATQILSMDNERGEGVERAMVPISEAQTAQAKALAVSLGVSLKNVLLAVHLKALHSLSGQRRVTTGMVTNGRPEAMGGESVLGLFLNSLPFNNEMPSCSWSQWIKELTRQEQTLWRHRRYPMATLKREYGGELFHTLFNYTHFRAYATQAEDGVNPLFGRGAEGLEQAGFEHSNYAFILQAGLTPEGSNIYLMLEVDHAQYSVNDLNRAVETYGRCFEQLLNDVEGQCDLAMLTSQEEEQLKHWQGEASHESGDVWQAFEAVVKSQPDGIAVREGERQVSYQALAERVAQWSSVLQAEGVSSGEAVGVLLDRGVDAITAILAIVRCGARYVPLDKGYPDTRIASMLSTAGVSVVLTDGSEHEGMKGARSLALQDIDKRRCAPCEAVSRSGVSGLYVMYTSGSTGTPKGVQVPDGAVLRLCRQPTLSLSAQDTLLLQAPLVFDASTLELWGALLNGATVAIGQGGAMSVPRLAQDIEQYGVSVLWLTASLFHVVMDEQPDALSGLRCLIAGGDTLSGRHVSEYLGADASRKLVNGYGPTEATTFSCLYAMNTHDAHQDVPIGYPLAQSSCYVLNDAAQRVPLGVPGELYVGGAGLADGYLGESVKTALAFVPNPYGPAGSRMYRTGDRVRYNAAGALEFLGRQDAQVKIRGYRIELGEISHALDSYEGLVHALVWVDEEGGHKRLMAAVSGEVDAVEVQGYLRDSLPDYMQPHRVHVLSQMPLTINGKIDKAQVMRMLAAQDKESQGESAAQPASELEARLIAIWEDVLQVDSVSRHDSFFELGGDSILSIQLAARAAADDIHFSLEDLFEHDTVAALAKAIGQEQTTDTHHQQTQAFELIDKDLAAQLPNEIEDAYPLSQTQLGMLYHSERGRAYSAYHDILTHTVQLPFVEQTWRQAWQHIIARHAILRTAFDMASYHEALQLVYSHAELPLTVEEQQALSTAERQARLAQWIAEEKALGFDWQQPGLLRGHVFVHKDNAFVLGLSFHHAIMDGWSTSILMRDLTDVYQALLSGDNASLPEMHAGYCDYIAQEQQALADEQTQAYWQDMVAQQQATQILSMDNERGEGVERAIVPISEAQTAQAKALAVSLGVSLKNVLLAVHLKALHSLSGQRRVTTGMVTNGRPEAMGGESVLGLFLNSLPFNNEMPSCSWSQWIKELTRQEQTLWRHRRYPMATLKREYGGELFHTLFNYTHFRAYATQAEDGVNPLFGRGAEGLEQAGFEHSNYAFILQAGLTPEGSNIYLMLEVDHAQYSVNDLNRAVETYGRCFEQLLNDVEGQCDLAMLTSQEEEQLKHWQGEASHESGDVWQAFEAVVKSQPDGIAVREGERQVSYQALAERVAQWSSVLQAEGVSSGEAVGVLLDRGVDAITAILAIVRCGARYVPLDKGYPDTRIASMLSTAGVSVVLTDGSEHEGIKGARSLALQDIDKRRCAPCEAVSRSGVSGLYVMYTSGSTGTPKGVQVPDGAVLRLCRQPTLSLSAQDTLLLQAPLVFDASTLELWGALLNGATVAIGQGGAMSVPRLAQDIEQYGVSVLWLTASLFHVVMDEQPDALSGLRCLIAGGDTLSGRHVSEYLGADASRKLVNGYGPTEATTFSCLYAMNTHDAHQDVPIGYPLAQSSCYVLNDAAQRVPLGVPGELYVGGAGLADGYLGESVKTALAFVPNPYGPAGSRMYRTGDRVRYNAAGALEFLGRQDAQVKIRGYRIELGEISHALDSYEGLVHALVWVDEEGGHKRLMAAVSGEVDAVEVQGYLRDSLPDYMQPHRVHVLSQMPLTINGKIDKAQVMRMLAAQDKESQGESAAQPASELEARLIAIWEDVLQVDSVSRHDSFFELGGDSILSIQLAARAAADDIHFSLEDLFEHDTVAALAKALEEGEVTKIDQQETDSFDLLDEEDRLAIFENA
ncbi:amino acid adenylation domain-containing protein [Ningiella sp. W23]|uniref:non-ribosomal peptide synthetase n=1 Tax=Ningiella sp. W23 TaxID=3023715 RepID=UPI003757567C